LIIKASTPSVQKLTYNIASMNGDFALTLFIVILMTMYIQRSAL